MTKTYDLAFDPHQPRDTKGRWTDTGLDPTGDLPGVAPLGPAAPLSDLDMQSLEDYVNNSASTNEIGDPFPKQPPTYAVVADYYEWADRDRTGSDKTPAMVTSIREQGNAQIAAKVWYSNVPDSASSTEKQGAGTWEQYQDPAIYGKINQTLRAKKDLWGPSYKIVKASVDAMFAKGGYTTQAPMQIYRALRSSNQEQATGVPDWAQKLQPGTVFQEDGIVSATAHNRFAQGWLALDAKGNEVDAEKPDDVVLEIHVPKGTRIVGGDPQFIETMLPPGTKMKIISSEVRTASKAVSPLSNDKLPSFQYTHVKAEVVQ